MARVALYLFLLFLLLTVLRGFRIFWNSFFRGTQTGSFPKKGRGVREAEMVRDPVCGTWIDRGLALSARRGSEIVPVCSEQCRNRLEAAG